MLEREEQKASNTGLDVFHELSTFPGTSEYSISREVPALALLRTFFKRAHKKAVGESESTRAFDVRTRGRA